MDIFAYLEGMAAQHGPSGQEAQVSAWLAERFKPLCDSVTIDSLYNVIALKKATRPTSDGSPAPKVMLSAHQDEIALMVADVLPDGTLRMGSVGGVDPRILPASTVMVHASGETGQIRQMLGVVGATPPHLLSEADRGHNYKREDLFVDLGMETEAVKKLVQIGDLITLQGPATRLLNDRAASKTMDDRACVGSLLCAAEKLQTMNHLCDIYFVASTQEEVGAWGAYTAAYTVDPDLAVVLDVTHATIPASKPDTTVPLDAPAATYGPFVQHKLLDRLKKTAKDYGVALNTEYATSRTGTDTDLIQIAREGVPCVLIDLPLKYMHTTVELLDMHAISECGRLLAHFLSGLTEDWGAELWN
ncbi:MAG: M20/M25/M40 family metallo-hydrolase [Eubacteriales bacterium]|nr:M20/M25/M40 family metallo-hydrolase [Eubacteriales bacterium]